MSSLFDFLPDVPSKEEIMSAAVDIVLPEECEAKNYREDASYEVPPPHETSGAATFFGDAGGPSGAAGGGVAFACCLVVLLVLWAGLELALRRTRCHPGATPNTAAFVLFFLFTLASGAVVIAAAVQLNASARSVADGLRVIQGKVGATSLLLTEALGSVETTVLSLARVAVDGNVGCLPLTDGIVDAVVGLVSDYVAPYFDDWSSLPDEILGPLEEDLRADAADIERHGMILQWVLIWLSLTGLVGASVIVSWRAPCHSKESCCHCIQKIHSRTATCITLLVVVLMSLTFGFGVAGLLAASEFCSDPTGQLEVMAMAKESNGADPVLVSMKMDALRYYTSCEAPANTDEVSSLQLPIVLFQASCYSAYMQEYDPEDVPTLCESERMNEEFGRDKGELAALMDKVVNTTSCAAVNSAYRGIISEACGDAVRWTSAAVWSAALLAVFAVAVVAFGRRRVGTQESLECAIPTEFQEAGARVANGRLPRSRSQTPGLEVGARASNITSI